MEYKRVAWNEIYDRLGSAPAGRLYGIPRGGSIVAGLTGRAVDCAEDADWLVEDVIESSGSALRRTARIGKPVWALFDRERDGLNSHELVMPWEVPTSGHVQRVTLERIGFELIEALGYEPGAERLRETPTRWARWWQEFLAPEPAARLDSTFEIAESGRMVIVSGMRMWSVCEHHLMPFSISVSIAYVPRGRVLGLSKFARLSHQVAHRLQLQERLAAEIADTAATLTSSPDVAVLADGRHLCMEARGVKTAAIATSFVARGAFERDASLRAEFIALRTKGIPGPEQQGE